VDAGGAERLAPLSAWVVSTVLTAAESLGAPRTPNGRIKDSKFGWICSGWWAGRRQDPKVIAESRQIADHYLTEPAKVNATLGSRLLSVASVHGDARSRSGGEDRGDSKDPKLPARRYTRLARRQGSELMRTRTGVCASGKVRIRMRRAVLDRAWRVNRRHAVAYIEQNWPRGRPSSLRRRRWSAVSSTSGFRHCKKRIKTKLSDVQVKRISSPRHKHWRIGQAPRVRRTRSTTAWTCARSRAVTCSVAQFQAQRG